MKKRIDDKTCNKVIMYELGMCDSFPITVKVNQFLKKDSPIFNSKNSHKRTNKR
jgi:hypothetical protein